MNWRPQSEVFFDNAVEPLVGRAQHEVLSVAKGVLGIDGDLHMLCKPDLLQGLIGQAFAPLEAAELDCSAEYLSAV